MLDVVVLSIDINSLNTPYRNKSKYIHIYNNNNIINIIYILTFTRVLGDFLLLGVFSFVIVFGSSASKPTFEKSKVNGQTSDGHFLGHVHLLFVSLAMDQCKSRVLI
jgi:hypothetical protein